MHQADHPARSAGDADPPDPTPEPRTRRHRARTVAYAIFAVLVVGAASVFSVRAAAGGDDIRANLTLIAPAGPGGGWDTFQREQQQAMRANKLVNNVQVVDVPGAAGTIALGKLTTMSGQPNKLMVSGTGLVAGVAQLHAPVTHRDVTPIARVAEEYDVVVVKADSPHRTLADLVAAWKKNPRKVAWTGGGTFDQLVSTDLALKAGIDPAALTYIPKSGGGEATTALLNGSAQAATSGYLDVADQIAAGRLRALGLAAPKRLPGVDIATLTEQGYATTLANWRMMCAPPGITAAQKAQLVELVTASVATPQWQAAQRRNHWSPVFLTGPELDSWLRREETRIADLVQELT